MPDQPAGGARIRVTGLTKSFVARRAVDDVDFEVAPGSIHGLLGPNGSGKTTILRMLLGLVAPDAGRIEVSDRELVLGAPRGPSGLAGFVESPSFYPYLTASRNLEMLSAWDGRRAHARVEELLERVGLSDRAHSKVRGFSAGMRQRLGLAAALIGEPDVLVLDEPTTALDPAGLRDLRGILTAMAGSGRAVLFSSHDLSEVEQLCTTVTVLRSGSVVYDGSLPQLGQRTPGRRWRLHTSDDASVTRIVESRGSVRVVPGDAGALVVEGNAPDVNVLLRDLLSSSIDLLEFGQQELPFESLYFQLTEADSSRQLAEGRRG